MATSEENAIWVQKKSRFPGPTPSNAPVMDLPASKLLNISSILKNHTFVISCKRVCLQLCCVLLCVGIDMEGGRQASPLRPLRIYPSDSALSDSPPPTPPPLLLPIQLGPLSFSPSVSVPSFLPLPPHCRYEGMEGGGGGTLVT